MRVRLRGIHKVRSKGRVYVYAWRGGPRLYEEPGTPAFIAEYKAALDERMEPEPNTISALVTSYKRAAGAKAKGFMPYLDLVLDEFGEAQIAAFENKRMRGAIKEWRDGFAATPRKADLAVAALRVVLEHGYDNGDLSVNLARRIKPLHKADHSEEIWEPQHLEAFRSEASKELLWAFELARLTGLRRGDLVRITWTADKGDHLRWKTSKRQKLALIPITPELRALLDSVKAAKRSATTILTSSKGEPWAPDGLSTVEGRVRRKKGIPRRWHDLRGNAAAHYIRRGFDDREIAEFMGWEEKNVAKIRRIYVSSSEIMSLAVERLTNETVKPSVKPLSSGEAK